MSNNFLIIITEDGKETVNAMFPLRTFIANLADKRGRRCLRITMELELSDGQLKEEMEQRLPQIRDKILMIIPTKTYNDLSSPDGKAALRGEILAELNDLLGKGSISNLYFTEFVIQ